MKTKHTPGPWFVTSNGTQGAIAALISLDMNDDDLEYVCFIEDHGRKTANARLIAAAPDLLVALENIVEFAAQCASELDCRPQCVSHAWDTIAKARGEA